jgi:hypothetical protein
MPCAMRLSARPSRTASLTLARSRRSSRDEVLQEVRKLAHLILAMLAQLVVDGFRDRPEPILLIQ